VKLGFEVCHSRAGRVFPGSGWGPWACRCLGAGTGLEFRVCSGKKWGKAQTAERVCVLVNGVFGKVFG